MSKVKTNEEFLSKTMGYNKEKNMARKQDIAMKGEIIMLQNFASEVFDIDCWDYLPDFGEYRTLIYGTTDYGNGANFSITAQMSTVSYDRIYNSRKMKIEIIAKIDAGNDFCAMERFDIRAPSMSLDEALLTISTYISNFSGDANRKSSALEMIRFCKNYIEMNKDEKAPF